MKIIDAYWEKRNLGVTTTEIVIESADSFESVADAYSKLQETQYNVVKIPSNHPGFLSFFQKNGYSFIETAIGLDLNISELIIPKRLVSICNHIACEAMNDKDILELESEYDKEIFKTDRIYLDDFFEKKQSGERYKLWTRDLIAQGNLPYKVLYDGNTVGFLLNKKIDEKVYGGILAGTYKTYEGTGMGYCVQYAGVLIAKEHGAKKYRGNISANNPSVLRILETMGFKISKMDYVLVKHNK